MTFNKKCEKIEIWNISQQNANPWIGSLVAVWLSFSRFAEKKNKWARKCSIRSEAARDKWTTDRNRRPRCGFLVPDKLSHNETHKQKQNGHKNAIISKLLNAGFLLFLLRRGISGWLALVQLKFIAIVLFDKLP